MNEDFIGGDGMRIGMYAVYRGKEFKAAKLNDREYKIIDYGNQPAPGFKSSEFQLRAFIKTVDRGDLDEVYLVKTYADYRGERLEITDDKEETVVLATMDEMTAWRLGMEKIDRCDFRLEVRKSDVDRFFEETERL